MNQTSMSTGAITLQQAAEFIWKEADILDRADYTAWLDLWTDDGLYIIPVDPFTTDHANNLNLVYDDAQMRAARVKRLTGGFAISAAPPARTLRLNARFVCLAEEAGSITVRSAMHLTENKFGRIRSFAATVDHTISRTPAGDRIAGKIVRLLNSDGELTSFSYLF